MLSIGKISVVTLLLFLAALMLGGCGGSDSSGSSPRPSSPVRPGIGQPMDMGLGQQNGKPGNHLRRINGYCRHIGGQRGWRLWTDSAGNFWFFGGDGYDSGANYGVFNDLWKFNGTNWIWVAGSNTRNPPGTYGASTGTTGTPGARVAGRFLDRPGRAISGSSAAPAMMGWVAVANSTTSGNTTGGTGPGWPGAKQTVSQALTAERRPCRGRVAVLQLGPIWPAIFGF